MTVGVIDQDEGIRVILWQTVLRNHIKIAYQYSGEGEGVVLFFVCFVLFFCSVASRCRPKPGTASGHIRKK